MNKDDDYVCPDPIRSFDVKLRKKMEWISVKDRQPEEGQMIAVCVDRMQTGCVCRYCENEEEKLPCLIYGPLRCLKFTWKDVSHWMPLPGVPNE